MSAGRPTAKDLRVLRELARETAELGSPVVDWSRVERGVLASLESRHERASAAQSPKARARWSWVAPLAIAASVGALWWTQTAHAPRAQPLGRRVIPNVHDAAGWTVDAPLERGDIVDSGGDRFHYELPGVVSFALPAGTQVEVVDVEPRRDLASLTIALRWGSIHAEVIHREHGEAFGVEVDGTRVAVHGTSFSVAREDDRALVDVRHGSVAVGPVGHRGATQGWLVVGPDRASFSLDGAKDVRWLHAQASPPAALGPAPLAPAHEPLPLPPVIVNGPRATRAPALRDPSPSIAATPANGSAVAPPAPSAPLDREAVQTRESTSILRKLEACYAKQASTLGMRFSVDSILTLYLYPTGVIRQGVFDPPLSPTLMRCATDAINEARYAPSRDAVELRVPVHLQISDR